MWRMSTHGLLSVVSVHWHLPGGDEEKWDTFQSVQWVSGIRFEPLTSEIWKKLSTHPNAAFDRNIYSIARKRIGLHKMT
jgi:hypothetical protein